MKKLLAILFLVYLTSLAFGQKKPLMVNTYLKIGADGEQIFCGYTIAELTFYNQRITINSPYGSIDLEIVERSRERWIGQDQYKNEYEITAFGLDNTLGVLIVPVDKTKHLLAMAMIKSPKLCE
jgi:hypothetical protein